MTTEILYKRFASFITQSINTFVSVLKIIIKSKYGVRLPLAEGQKCIVLANGPSLKLSFEKHPDFFKQYPLICVNTFAVTTEFEQFKPRYYVILDPGFWESEKESIKNTFKSLAEKTTWKLYLLIPQYAVSQPVFETLIKKNSNIELIPFNYTVFKGFPSIAHWFYKKNMAMPQSWNVTITALFLGINIGYKEVVLVGADHTWHENLYMSDDNILHTKVPHFWEDQQKIEYVPLYKGKPHEREVRKAHDFFDVWSRTFYGYMLINDYALSRNCTIYNASEVSFIDAFKRIKLLVI